MTANQNNFNDAPNPLAVLFKILANSLLEDKYGINGTAYNTLLILGAAIDKNLAADIKKKSGERRNRYRYE